MELAVTFEEAISILLATAFYFTHLRSFNKHQKKIPIKFNLTTENNKKVPKIRAHNIFNRQCISYTHLQNKMMINYHIIIKYR